MYLSVSLEEAAFLAKVGRSCIERSPRRKGSILFVRSVLYNDIDDKWLKSCFRLTVVNLTEEWNITSTSFRGCIPLMFVPIFIVTSVAQSTSAKKAHRLSE